MTILLISLCVFLFFLITGLFVWSFSSVVGLFRARGVPYVPLSRWQLRFLNDNVKLKSTDKTIDLGCGDGRVLRLFEKQGVEDLTGYDVNFWAFLQARVKNLFLKSKAKVYLKNFEKIDLAEFDVVFCYLFERYFKNLKDKFDKELKPGAIVVSYAFEIKDWRKPVNVYHFKKKKYLSRIFVYKM